MLINYYSIYCTKKSDMPLDSYKTKLIQKNIQKIVPVCSNEINKKFPQLKNENTYILSENDKEEFFITNYIGNENCDILIKNDLNLNKIFQDLQFFNITKTPENQKEYFALLLGFLSVFAMVNGEEGTIHKYNNVNVCYGKRIDDKCIELFCNSIGDIQYDDLKSLWKDALRDRDNYKIFLNQEFKVLYNDIVQDINNFLDQKKENPSKNHNNQEEQFKFLKILSDEEHLLYQIVIFTLFVVEYESEDKSKFTQIMQDFKDIKANKIIIENKKNDIKDIFNAISKNSNSESKKSGNYGPVFALMFGGSIGLLATKAKNKKNINIKKENNIKNDIEINNIQDDEINNIENNFIIKDNDKINSIENDIKTR